MTEIKVCGITSVEDALMVEDAGVDALGFVFAPSPRRVTVERAKSIAKCLGERVVRVGVFVDEDVDVVRQIASEIPLDMVQLHGSEGVEFVAQLGLPFIKAFRARDRSVLKEIVRFGAIDFLLDSFVAGVGGGSGSSVDIAVASEASALGRMVLAGGLTVDNVRGAIERVKPCAVDVSTGVERMPGVKDHEKVRNFVNEVRRCDCQTKGAILDSSGVSLFRRRFIQH